MTDREVQSWLIGRGDDCDLKVEAADVSYHHCRLTLNGGRYVLEDLGSSNGTFANGRRVTRPTTVARSDQILLSQSVPMPWPDVGPPQRPAKPVAQPPAYSSPHGPGAGFFGRLFTVDLNRVEPSWNERQALVNRGITEPLAQKYLCWRRPMLWCAFVLLLCLWLHEMRGIVVQFTDTRSEVADAMVGLYVFLFVLAFILLLGCLLIAAAAGNWALAKRSVVLARIGLLLVFLTPLLFGFIPTSIFVDQSRIAPAASREEWVAFEMLLGVFLGIYAYISIVPAIFGVFPGLTRCFLAMKTLLPQSPSLGHLLWLVVPIYSLYVLALGAAVNKLGFFPALMTGTICFVLAALSLLLIRNLFRRGTPDEIALAVKQGRIWLWSINILGVLMMVVFVVMHYDQLSQLLHLINERFPNINITMGDILWTTGEFAVQFFAMGTLVAVVASDFLLAATLKMHGRQAEPQSKEHERALEDKLARLQNLQAAAEGTT